MYLMSDKYLNLVGMYSNTAVNNSLHVLCVEITET
jgi:hypothetical protein